MSSGIQASLLSGLAEDLARQHGSVEGTLNQTDISARLGNLRQNIEQIYKSLADMPAEEIRELASIEWLLDNEYVIQEAFQQLKRDLPRRFYRQLPKVEHADLGAIARGRERKYAVEKRTHRFRGIEANEDLP